MGVANPDGYEYTFTDDRLWRKTRSPQGICYGVDPNRNFAYHWGELGVSTNPCSDTFCGDRAFSEVEPDNVEEHIELGDAAVEAIFNTHGIVFVNENSASLYPASGDANDWYTHDVGIRWSYTI